MQINLFSTPIIISNIDTSLIKLDAKMGNKWYSNTNTSHGNKNTLTSESYLELMKKLSNMVLPMIGGSATLHLDNIWRNEYIKEDYQENHIHTDTHFSFIIYVKGESQTVFFAPSKYLIESFYGDLELFPLSHDVECREGQIVLFPSYLEHMVKKNSGVITYAGNIKILNHKNKQASFKLPETLPNTQKITE